jgi:hypothetical protein
MADGERSDGVKRIERWWPVALLLILGAIISSLVTVGGALNDVKSAVRGLWGSDWPETEYAKLEALGLGVDVRETTRSPGEAKAKRRLRLGRTDENLLVQWYTRPGWMAVIMSDSDGQVTQWQAIGCSERFRPTLDDGGPAATRRRARLYVSRLRDVSRRFPRRSERSDVSGYWEGDEASYNVSDMTEASMWVGD